MTSTFLEDVTLLEVPSPHSPFYVVEGTQGRHYVSPMGGRAAKGLPLGVTLRLYYNVISPSLTAYVLERS